MDMEACGVAFQMEDGEQQHQAVLGQRCIPDPVCVGGDRVGFNPVFLLPLLRVSLLVRCEYPSLLFCFKYLCNLNVRNIDLTYG